MARDAGPREYLVEAARDAQAHSLFLQLARLRTGRGPLARVPRPRCSAPLTGAKRKADEAPAPSPSPSLPLSPLPSPSPLPLDLTFLFCEAEAAASVA